MNSKVKFLTISLFLIIGIFAINTSILVPSQKESLQVLAHRGLHQTFNPIGIKNDTCTAARIDKPVHDFIENTLPSIQGAIDLGANIIEFDIHPTIDGEFIIFHDWNLDCRTNGIGVTRMQSSQYLKTLDIGYGYTADGGNTYPFRGKFVGEMPTLGELLNKFPNIGFLINIKSKSIDEAVKLTEYLQKHEKTANRKRLFILGSVEVITAFKELNNDITTLSKQKAKNCLKSYLLTGWSGYMPESCHHSLVPIPENYQWLVWGWPNRFEERLKKVGSRSLLLGKSIKGMGTVGIDSVESIEKIPEDFGGIIFTNRIDLIGKHLDRTNQ